MTTTMKLSERQIREQNYYDLYASLHGPQTEIDFAPVEGKDKRPWNSYWSVYQVAAENFRGNSTLLDFGSGPGENALRFNKLGYKIEGFDISEKNISLSEDLFRTFGQSLEARFQVSPAEQLPYADESIEFIAGIDILHHVEIEPAIRECRRVLKKDGVAVFREPIEVPFLDWIRNLKIVKAVAPKHTSFELHITEDERKLTAKDLQLIQEIFPKVELRRSFIFARFDKFFREGSRPDSSMLEKLDYYLLSYFPFLGSLGGTVVMVLKK